SIYTTLAFIIIWTGVLYLLKKENFAKTVASVLIIAVTFCEVIIADPAAFNFNQKQSSYVENYDKYREAVSYVENSDDSDYRMELCSLNTRMDPCLYGYSGMSAFSSMAYENYSGLQYSLGMYGNRINSYTYNIQTPVYNMMYNIKYLIYRNEQVRPSTQLYTRYYDNSDTGITVFENDYYLPKIFCVNSAVEAWNTAEGDPFRVQNDFFTLATGYSDVFKSVKYKSTSFIALKGDEISDNGTQWIEKDANSSYSSVEITASAAVSGNLYIYLTSSDIKSITVSKNDKQYSYSIETPYIIDLGYAESGDEFNISLDCGGIDTGESSYEIYAYSVNKEMLDAGYGALSAEAFRAEKATDTKITGTIKSSGSKILYSSIPYDSGWSVYIDGEKADTIKIGDCQLGVMIEKGEHTVEYIYKPKGLAAGTAVSAAAVLALTSAYIVIRKKKKANNNKLIKS
ncbi:MAG: YfhO family protein, partial [Clostridiales bacterium]|nr:YfhO family protein [Clostridiales bacterium]